MRKLLWLLWVPVILACSEEEVGAEVLSQSFYGDSQLSNDYPYVGPGDRMVLHRYFKADDEPNIADDEYAEDFLLELPASVGNSFVLEGEALTELNALYNQYCFCFAGDLFQMTGGEISGTRIPQGWFVEVDVSYEQGYLNPQDGDTVIVDVDTLTFSGIFTERPRP